MTCYTNIIISILYCIFLYNEDNLRPSRPTKHTKKNDNLKIMTTLHQFCPTSITDNLNEIMLFDLNNQHSHCHAHGRKHSAVKEIMPNAISTPEGERAYTPPCCRGNDPMTPGHAQKEGRCWTLLSVHLGI